MKRALYDRKSPALQYRTWSRAHYLYYAVGQLTNFDQVKRYPSDYCNASPFTIFPLFLSWHRLTAFR